jgi:hypothetical protein
MQRKSIFIFGSILLILLAGFLTLRATSVVTIEESTCCEKNATSCPEKTKSADDMLPENLSHQFIMITSPGL